MAGPWDGPVRVAERTRTSFRLVTLDGHLEAGQIRFSAHDRGFFFIEFEIESGHAARTASCTRLYDGLRMAKEITGAHVGVHAQRVAELAGGRVTGGIDIDTRRVPEPAPAGITRRLARAR